jgi:hypothetical protein
VGHLLDFGPAEIVGDNVRGSEAALISTSSCDRT